MKVDLLVPLWGRLLTCAAVGNRRWMLQPQQLADCQSAAG
jgi:hypothetical protein